MCAWGGGSENDSETGCSRPARTATIESDLASLEANVLCVASAREQTKNTIARGSSPVRLSWCLSREPAAASATPKKKTSAARLEMRSPLTLLSSFFSRSRCGSHGRHAPACLLMQRQRQGHMSGDKRALPCREGGQRGLKPLLDVFVFRCQLLFREAAQEALACCTS